MQINSYKLNLSSEHEYTQQTSVNITATQEARTINTAYSESEKLNLSAKGIFQTKDKTLSIDLSAELYRQDSYTTTTIQQTLKDPLVVNINGTIAKTDSKTGFEFDIDKDGAKEKISSLASGNGFLAIDLNGNGIIDDGGELFGAKSGNGFSDLASFDDNKDGVIDEQDSVFGKLKIWFKTNNKDSLVSLKSERVGAILLESISSQFELKNGADTNAKLQQSSIVLFENGKAGWISHVDFAVQEIQNNEPFKEKMKDFPTNVFIAAAQQKQTRTSDNTVSNAVKELQRKLKKIEKELIKTDDETKKEVLKFEKMQILAELASLGGPDFENA